MKNYPFLAALLLCLCSMTAAPAGAQTANTIYACYHKTTGGLRRVSGPGQCKNPELPISWGVAGTPGPRGPQGPVGPQGPQGDKGDPGKDAPFPSNVIIVAKSDAGATGVLRTALVGGGPEQAAIKNSSITAEGAGPTTGIDVSNRTVDVLNSQIYAPGNTIYVFQGPVFNQAQVRVAHSLPSGGPAIAASPSFVKCAAVTDENYDFFASTCP